MFPHHENEIAQSEGATGVKFCGCWVHNGFVNVGGEKMSKSKGNFLTLRTALHSALDVRAFRCGGTLDWLVVMLRRGCCDTTLSVWCGPWVSRLAELLPSATESMKRRCYL